MKSLKLINRNRHGVLCANNKLLMNGTYENHEFDSGLFPELRKRGCHERQPQVLRRLNSVPLAKSYS